MQFKQYPSYKNSGVEWLGDVPEHWGMNRLGLHFRNRKEKVSDKDFKPLSVTKHGIVPQLEHAAKSDNGDNRKLVRKGDYVINSRSDRKGSSGLADLDGSVSLINIVLTPFKTIHPKFSHYLLRSYLFQEEFYKYGHGIVADLWTTNYEDMRNIHLALPSVSEQTQISNFLEQETTRIDNLISKQEKLIELLEEQRKSIISHAVTKGLNPNAPMKDSGVEWLGEVPEDWEVKRFGYIFTENKKKNIGLIETNVLSLSYGNIKEKNIDDNKGLLPESFETYQIIEPNDIVFRFTDLQNDKRSLRNAISKYHGIITSAYIGVKTKENADFYNYLFRAYDLQKVFYSMGDGMRQSLKMDELNKMPIVLPKIEAQERIVKFINEENQRINNLVVKQKNLIEKLKEYRSSIISHAVTGKIDVREFGA